MNQPIKPEREDGFHSKLKLVGSSAHNRNSDAARHLGPAQGRTMLNEEQNSAVELMDAGESLFLHGDAGTGKTVVINSFVEDNLDRVICLAPTIIIDEISMVRSDLLGDLDQGLRNFGDRRRPFGGLQVIAVGDFFQLPPVVETPEQEQYLQWKYGGVFAFETVTWRETEFKDFQLKTIHRQIDSEFLSLLRAVRDRPDDLWRQLQKFDSRICRQPPSQARRLCCSRAIAAHINQVIVKRLPTPGQVFYGACSGIFPEGDRPTETKLSLKYDMFVLILANDPEGEYANGDVGLIVDMDETGVYVELQRGTQVRVKRHEWRNYDYRLERKNGECRLVQTIIGSYRQLPLAPAYAMTIHKSQGQTLDQIHLMFGNRPCFAHGQLYTALSRARRLEDITLDRSLALADVIVDERVSRFYKSIS